MSIDAKINTARFYFEYKGHPIEDVKTFFQLVTARRPSKPIVYLAGDSSLDNKYWLPTPAHGGEPLPAPIPTIYNDTFSKPNPKADVAFWLNSLLGDKATAMNLAVEASLLRERKGCLLEHDEFIRDNITPEDTLIVSIGANDIAMSPRVSTVLHMLVLAWCMPLSWLQSGSAWGVGYFLRMFRDGVQDYVVKLVEKQKPKMVVICMIYYPLEAQAGKQESWAEAALRFLGYNSYPNRLQALISAMFEKATKQIQLEGVRIMPFALYRVLDGKQPADYVARVEPSVEGGRKMAAELIRVLDIS